MALKSSISNFIFVFARYYYQADFTKAEKLCLLALKIYKKNKTVCVKLGRLYDKIKKFQNGISYWCNAFIYSDKNNTEAYNCIIKDIIRLKLIIIPEEVIEQYFDNNAKKILIVSNAIKDQNRAKLYELILQQVNILFKEKKHEEAQKELIEMFLYDFNSIKYAVDLLLKKQYGKQFNYFMLAESIKYLPNDTNIMTQLLDVYFAIDKNLIKYDFVDNLVKKLYDCI